MTERDYRFDLVEDLIRLAQEENVTVGEVALRYEIQHSSRTRSEVWESMRTRWRFMQQSMDEGLAQPQSTMGGLSPGLAPTLARHQPIFLDAVAVGGMARALAVNECSAAMKRIVAAPTAGSSGILPSALWLGQERLQATEDQVIDGMFVAGALGMVMANNATISGAKGGCMAEVGVSCAMAAG
ncbi:MAG: L-serine ammonia-lyase, iron-sulfur-dependent, subunit alpha, partial [Cyanobacteria bacterium REEB65]|nr:L-serine ammonia-lyase, iron-sulfur-dependent, subunit alpha [Cyanobacteria bacterium REEB65]